MRYAITYSRNLHIRKNGLIASRSAVHVCYETKLRCYVVTALCDNVNKTIFQKDILFTGKNQRL